MFTPGYFYLGPVFAMPMRYVDESPRAIDLLSEIGRASLDTSTTCSTRDASAGGYRTVESLSIRACDATRDATGYVP